MNPNRRLDRVLVKLANSSFVQRAWWKLNARGWGTWRVLIPVEEFETCLAELIYTLEQHVEGNDFGDYLEFGVSRGTSMIGAYRAFQEAGLKESRFVGFDSFKGLPREAKHEGWTPGQYSSTQTATLNHLRAQGLDMTRIELVAGWFKDTLNDATRQKLSIHKASLIMIDCDIQSSTRDALNFCIPCIKDYAIVLFDDWGSAVSRGIVGQKEAFEEFLAANPSFKATSLKSYSPNAMVFLLNRS